MEMRVYTCGKSGISLGSSVRSMVSNKLSNPLFLILSMLVVISVLKAVRFFRLANSLVNGQNWNYL